MTDTAAKPKAPRRKIAACRDNSKSAGVRTLMLDTAEKLMLDEGYAAVSTRRLAKEAGLKAPLVHYYFPTTDDLFLAVFQRSVERNLALLDEAGDSANPAFNIWSSYKNPGHTALFLEFMALSNHRKAIRNEIARYTETARQRRAEVLARELNLRGIQPEGCSAAGLAVLMIGVARTLVMEEGLGVSLGHADATAFVEWWLERLKKQPE